MTNSSLTASEIADLRALAGMIIPASERYRVPGADDDAIFTDILRSLDRDLADIRVALGKLTSLSGGSFTALTADRRREVAAALRAEGGSALAALTRVVMLCYYRDDRVMASLGMEARPPFPKGHQVEQGDWSLLDPVRARLPMWRRA